MIEHKKLVLLVTLVAFACSIGGLQFLRQEYFPASTRLDLIVQLELPAGSTAENTERVASRFAQELNNRSELDYYTYHTGEGAPRFVLTFEPANGKPNFAEFVLVAKDLAGRQKLEQDITQLLQEKFPEIKSHQKVILTGDSFDYPTMLRVEGPDLGQVKEIAEQVAARMRQDPAVRNVNLKTGTGHSADYGCSSQSSAGRYGPEPEPGYETGDGGRDHQCVSGGGSLTANRFPSSRKSGGTG